MTALRVATFAVLVVLTGCSGVSEPDPGTIQESRSTASAAPASTLPAPGTTNAESDPRFSTVDLPQLVRLDGAYLLAGGDGVYLAAEPGTNRMDDTRLSLIDPGEAEPTHLPRIPSAVPQQVIGGAVNEHWAVWLEHPGDSLDVSSWTLYAFDRVSGRTRAVTTAAQLAGLPAGAEVPTAPGYSQPSLLGNTVVLSAVSKSPRTVSVFSLDLSVTPVRPRLVASGRGAFVNGADVVYLRRSKRTIQVVAQDTAGSAPQVLASANGGCSSVSAMAGGHDTIAWIMECDGADVVTIRAGDGREWTIESENLGYLNAEADIVTFARATDDGDYVQYVVVVSTGEVLQLGEGSVAGDTVVAGDVIAWRALNGQKVGFTSKIVSCSCG